MATYYAITWIETPANPTMEPYRRGPVLVRRSIDRLLWLNGSWCGWPTNAEILKIYQARDADAALLAFYRDYPPQSTPPRHSAGWIAPDGAFYPCSAWAHDSKAEVLTALHYSSLDGTRLLERRGWLRLHLDGLIGSLHTIELSQPQRDTVFDLAQIEDAPGEWRHNLQTALDLY